MNVAVFGRSFPSCQLIQEGDNTTEGAMLLGTSKVPDQQYITRRYRDTEGYRHCKHRLWFEHSSGLGLWVSTMRAVVSTTQCSRIWRRLSVDDATASTSGTMCLASLRSSRMCCTTRLPT